MKNSDFNRLIRNHLLAVFDSYETSKRGDLFVVPMNHMWRGFIFEPSADASAFYISVNVIPLYMLSDFLWIGFGWRLGNMWIWEEARSNEIISKLIDAMKLAERHLLDKYQTPRDLASTGLERRDEKALDTLEISACSLVFTGQFAEAIPIFNDLLARISSYKRSDEEEPSKMELQIKLLQKLIMTNPQQAQTQLLEWEQQTIKKLKLETFPN